LAVSDFNGDNRRDVFTAAALDFESPPIVNVLLGRGDGGFVRAETFSVGTVPTMIGTGEIFGTGRTDVAIAGYDYISGEQGVLALFNDGLWWTPSPPSPALPGDYNGNGTVDAADFTVWRDALGQSGLVPYSGADGNGNGSIGPEDYAIWKSHFGQSAPVPVGGGGIALVTAGEQEVQPGVPIVQSPAETTSERPKTAPTAARAASLAEIEIPSRWQDSRSSSRGRTHRYRVSELDGNNLLLLAIDRVWRSPPQESYVIHERGGDNPRADELDIRSFFNELRTSALAEWR
jgi:hypothetical protein